jgi:hypothetical protein
VQAQYAPLTSVHGFGKHTTLCKLVLPMLCHVMYVHPRVSLVLSIALSRHVCHVMYVHPRVRLVLSMLCVVMYVHARVKIPDSLSLKDAINMQCHVYAGPGACV